MYIDTYNACSYSCHCHFRHRPLRHTVPLCLLAIWPHADKISHDLSTCSLILNIPTVNTSLQQPVYSTLFKRNSIFVSTVFLTAFSFSIGFDLVTSSFWDYHNRGVSLFLFSVSHRVTSLAEECCGDEAVSWLPCVADRGSWWNACRGAGRDRFLESTRYKCRSKEYHFTLPSPPSPPSLTSNLSIERN